MPTLLDDLDAQTAREAALLAKIRSIPDGTLVTIVAETMRPPGGEPTHVFTTTGALYQVRPDSPSRWVGDTPVLINGDVVAYGLRSIEVVS